jgi:hypothetical protein
MYSEEGVDMEDITQILLMQGVLNLFGALLVPLKVLLRRRGFYSPHNYDYVAFLAGPSRNQTHSITVEKNDKIRNNNYSSCCFMVGFLRATRPAFS